MSSILQQLEESLSSMGWGRYQSYLFWLCGLVLPTQGWAADMMWVMLVAIVMNEIGEDWGLSDFTLSLYAMSQSTGVFLGSYFWGYMSDKYGRMFSFKKTLLLCGVGGCVAACSVDFPMLCVMAFVVGMGIGGDIAVDGTVFIEFCPKSQRHMLTLMSVVCVLGSIFVPALALGLTVLLKKGIWRWMVFTVSVLNLIFGLMRWKCLETPHFYVTQGRVESANAVLRKLANINHCSYENIHLEDEEFPRYNQEFLQLPRNIGVKRQLNRLFNSSIRMTTVWFILVSTK